MPDPANQDVMIVSAVRSPIGGLGGVFKNVSAPSLGAAAMRAALARAGVAAEDVDEVIFGNVLQAGLGPNATRRAAVEAGIPFAVPSMTINKVCGSGLKAVAVGANTIRCGEADIIVAGGMENMSQAPFLLPDQRFGRKLGHAKALDSMIHDALWDCFYDCHMATTAENLADQYQISRAEQDRYAAASQKRYADALARGAWADELTPVHIIQGKGDDLSITQDEHPRPDTTADKLAKIKPAFDPSGTVTAGNSSGINDGAAAVVLMSQDACRKYGAAPLAVIKSCATIGVDARIMGIGPALAIRKLLEPTDLTLADIDLLEVNEAFAAQCLAVGKELKWDDSRVNVNGGAIAMGHPVGASGTRVLVTLLHEMRRRKSSRGIASLCIGGGMGIAMLLEKYL
jgi:acetyl-CoA C-acetyltransferase